MESIVMEKNSDFREYLEREVEELFAAMSQCNSEEDMRRLRMAFELADSAHSKQRRKSGEPYIIHPVEVAKIVALEIGLDVNSVIAAFLHDVVEDTDCTIEQIRDIFGEDVAFLVGTVTKKKKESYSMSKQVDNYKQMLASLQIDVRALLIKLADRLHNMRTLASMASEKQMKIAGETDYFYAPLATRLGLYRIKTELENLSFRFRCPQTYDYISDLIAKDIEENAADIEQFTNQIREILKKANITADVSVEYRQPYSLWRKMNKYGEDFHHLKYRNSVDIVFDPVEGETEKETTLRIYSLLTDRFKEKPGGILNYIDSPKESGYRSFHFKLVAKYGRWQEVHVCSRNMARDARLGCVTTCSNDGIERWIDKFRQALRDMEENNATSTNYIEDVVTSLYNDDIMVFTPKGDPVSLPQKSSVIDFAYEQGIEIGNHAHYARMNGRLANVTDRLSRGMIVEIITSPDAHPEEKWLEAATTYKARTAIRSYLDTCPRPQFARCQCCKPIPGEEVIGYKDPDTKITTVHKRDCPVVIRLASQYGDNILAVNYLPSERLYPVTIEILAVDRYHLLADITDSITNKLQLSMTNIWTKCEGALVKCTIEFAVHSIDELISIMAHIGSIDGVDAVREV